MYVGIYVYTYVHDRPCLKKHTYPLQGSTHFYQNQSPNVLHRWKLPTSISGESKCRRWKLRLRDSACASRIVCCCPSTRTCSPPPSNSWWTWSVFLQFLWWWIHWSWKPTSIFHHVGVIIWLSTISFIIIGFIITTLAPYLLLTLGDNDVIHYVMSHKYS